jgi:tetratricopeptide (TPR) repeat protein
VLLLEDWHWADEGSTTAAAHLAGSLGDHPILMVISHRPSDAFVWGTARARAIPLTPLTLDETGQLAESLLGSGAGLPGWLADAIYQHTGGNAFFVEQVCRALVDSLWDWKDIERLGEDKRRGALPIPDTVQAVLRARIDSLDAGDAEILRLASILGTEFPLWQLELLIGVAHPGEEALAGCMRRLASVDLLYAEGDRAETYRFKHAITQEVAYETLRRQRRRELHACAAKGIERANADALDGCCEALAYHYAAGEDHAQAARYAERAGDKAARTFSLEEARQQYRQALASLDSLEPDAEQMRRRIDVALKWAAACMFKPARDQLDVLGVSLEHARRLGHQAGIAYTLCWFGCIEYALGDQQRAVTTFAECMALANQLEDERLLAQLHLNIGQSHAAATEYGKAFEHLNEGLARKERGFARRPGAASAPRGVPAGSGRAYALGYLGLIHGDLGHFEQAQRYLTEALSLVREARSQALEGSILTQLALVQLWQGRWAAARATAKLMQGTAEQIHGPYILAMSKTVTGYASLLAGDGAEALELLRGSVAWLETTQIGLTLSWNQACLAEGLALRGHDVEARVHAWRALARADARDLLGEAAAHRALGLAEGRPDGSWHTARGCFETAIELAERKRSVRDVAVTRFRGAALALRFSEFRLGAEWLTGAIAQFAAMEMTWYREQALDLLRTFPDEAFCPLGRPAAAVDSSGDFETAPAPLAPADQKRNAIVPGSKK